MRIADVLNWLPIRVDLDGVPLGLDVIFGLARSNRLTTHDASYLELAIRLGLRLATNDSDLRDAAIRMGVEVL